MTCCDKAKMEAILVILDEYKVIWTKMRELTIRISEESQAVIDKHIYGGLRTISTDEVVDTLISLSEKNLELSKYVFETRQKHIDELKKLLANG